jgi:hypothetical protein
MTDTATTNAIIMITIIGIMTENTIRHTVIILTIITTIMAIRVNRINAIITIIMIEDIVIRETAFDYIVTIAINTSKEN